MKKLDLLILFLILYSLSISGQERSKQKDKNYLTWVSLINGQRNMKVLLYEINDSSVLLSTFINPHKQISDITAPAKIYYSNINFITTREKKSIRNGIIIGVITGIIAGGIIGLNEETDSFGGPLRPPRTSGQKAFGDIAGLIILGAPIGGLIGSFKIKIPINGNIERFNKNKN